MKLLAACLGMMISSVLSNAISSGFEELTLAYLATGSEEGPVATYQDLSPSDKSSVTREDHIPIEVKVTYAPPASEDMTYYTQVSVDGGNYQKNVFESTTIPAGHLTASEDIKFYVYVPSHKHMYVRMHGWAVGKGTNRTWDFLDIRHTYVVVASPHDGWWIRGTLRFFGLCS